jgi:putative ABC transport system permease protein
MTLMDLWTTFKLAVRTLFRNKMRTLLTMLGIIIGVGSVITMLAITAGAKKAIVERIKSFGNNVIFVHNQWGTRGGVRGGRSKRLDADDAKALQKECRHILYASPVVSQTAKVIRGSHNANTSIIGGSENMDYIQGWKVSKGRFVTEAEVHSAAKVCVIGSQVEKNLFNYGEEALGEIIRIKKTPFKVVGVLESRGTSGMQDQDDQIFIPYTTMMQRVFNRKNIRYIMASGTSMEELALAKEEATQLLRERRRLQPGVKEEFEIRTQEEILEMINKFSITFSLFLGAVASISLLVGGIGIMNIMLVSVNERIKEIGIRMAVGARGKDILYQFLVEAVALSVLGGIIGIAFGYIASYVVKVMTRWEMDVSLFSIMLSITFASAVGVFFGLYPAWKASKLDPIQALRHE